MLTAKQNGTSLHLATSCGSLSLVLQCVSIRSWPTTLSIFPLQDGATTCNVLVKCEVMIVMFSFLEAAYVVWICAKCGLPNKGKQGSTKFPGLHGGYSGLLMPRSWSLAHQNFIAKQASDSKNKELSKTASKSYELVLVYEWHEVRFCSARYLFTSSQSALAPACCGSTQQINTKKLWNFR